MSNTLDLKIYNPNQYETFDDNLADILIDALSGDKSVLDRPEIQSLGVNNIKAALQWLKDSDVNGDYKDLLTKEGWRLMYKRKPPTPEEFLTYDWIGAQAESLWPNVRKAFIEFMNPNPLNPKRGLALSVSIGWGKSLLTNLCMSYILTLFCLMREPYKLLGHSPMTSYSQPYGTLIQLKDNTWKPIECLIIGDELKPLLSEESIVTNIIDQGKQDTYELDFGNNKKVKCSIGHWWVVWDFKQNKYVKIQTKEFIKNKNRYGVPELETIKKDKNLIIECHNCFNLLKFFNIKIKTNSEIQNKSKKFLRLQKVIKLKRELHRCIEVSDSSHKYFSRIDYNTDPFITDNCICLCSYSLGKAWDLLGTPFEQFLEQSPMFERVPHREDVVHADKDDPNCTKLVYSTAARGTARMIFRNNLLLKMMSTEGALLGNAQPLYSKIMLPDNTYIEMGKLKIGDKIKSPTERESEVIGIFPQGKRDIFEIELDDGRKVRSSDNHLWKVAINKDQNNKWSWQIVTTLQLIDWLKEGKDIEIYDESNSPEVKV